MLSFCCVYGFVKLCAISLTTKTTMIKRKQISECVIQVLSEFLFVICWRIKNTLRKKNYAIAAYTERKWFQFRAAEFLWHTSALLQANASALDSVWRVWLIWMGCASCKRHLRYTIWSNLNWTGQFKLRAQIK